MPAMCSFLVCKIFGPNIWLCKFEKFHVCCVDVLNDIPWDVFQLAGTQDNDNGRVPNKTN